MEFNDFERRAHEMYAEVPAEYREGLDGMEVLREAVPHPSLPEIYTLGECLSEFYPSEFGGAGEVRSRVVLYHGSFLRLSELNPDWDWEGELWETITHEIRHHLESLASEDDLEDQDWAEDQNFRRRQGESFDPFFYRLGTPVGAGAYELDGDVFVEREVRDERAGIDFEWEGERVHLEPPEEMGEVTFLLVGEYENGSELNLVLLRRKGFLGWLRGLLSRAPLHVVQVEGRERR